MPPFTQHVFVCCNRRDPAHPRGCCDPAGSAALREALKAELKQHPPPGRIRINQAGCLDQCEAGPTLVIYPQGIWYGRVQVADVPRIVAQTLCRGEILPDLHIPDAALNCPEAARCWRSPAGISPGR